MSSLDSSYFETACVLEVSQSGETGVVNDHVFRNKMIAEMALTFQQVWDLVQSHNYLGAQQALATLRTTFAQVSGVDEDPQLKQDLTTITSYERTIQNLRSEQDAQQLVPREQDPLKPVPNP